MQFISCEFCPLQLSAINRWELKNNKSPSAPTLLRRSSDKTVGAAARNRDPILGYPEFEDRSHNKLYYMTGVR